MNIVVVSVGLKRSASGRGYGGGPAVGSRGGVPQRGSHGGIPAASGIQQQPFSEKLISHRRPTIVQLTETNIPNGLETRNSGPVKGGPGIRDGLAREARSGTADPRRRASSGKTAMVRLK